MAKVVVEEVAGDEFAAIREASRSDRRFGAVDHMGQVEDYAAQVGIGLKQRDELRAVAAADVDERLDTGEVVDARTAADSRPWIPTIAASKTWALSRCWPR